MFELYLSIFIDLVMILFYMITSYVAWRGLFIWKKQFNLKTEYNLAHQLLISVYKYRDAISFIRRSSIRYVPTSKHEKPHMTDDERIFHDDCNYYEEHYLSIENAKRELYTDVLVSEVHWNCDFKIIVEKLATVENDIRYTLKEYLDLSKPEHGKSVISKEYIKTSKKLFTKPGIEDKFSVEINSLIIEIEEFLKPKLKL